MEKLDFDYAQIGDVNLHYATAGTGERLVILLHGFPEFWYSWRHQIEVLSRDFTVVAPDLRGYNLSSKPPRIADYKIANMVDDVTGLIRHLGRRQAAVVGHDWGASIAWATAEKYPEYVSKLAALQVPPWAAWQQNAGWQQYLASWYMFLFQIPGLPEWVLSRRDFDLPEQGLRETNRRNATFTEEDIAEFKKSWRATGALTSPLNYYRANFVERFFARRGDNVKIIVPTLFIYGEKDKYILPATVRNVGRFVDARFVEVRIPDAGHWVQQEAPLQVSTALLDFLTS